MADDEAQAAAKIQKEMEAHNKEFEACSKKGDKLDALFKKALQAGKKLDKSQK